MITTDRITIGHLKRKAYLYIRQSTLYQAEQNPESLERQYDFRKQALNLGWHEDQIVTLDGDLGQSVPRRHTVRISNVWWPTWGWARWVWCSVWRFRGWLAIPRIGSGCWSCVR